MPDPSEAAPLLLSPPNAAKRLGVSWITFRRMIDAGEINYVQRTTGGTRWIEEAELLRWIEDHRTNAQSAPSDRVEVAATAA
jgi:excisionase family DNA binding protein